MQSTLTGADFWDEVILTEPGQIIKLLKLSKSILLY